MEAYLKNYRQSPRKVRLLADLVRGKSVERALSELSFMPKRAAGPLKKLIESAVANAEHNFNAKKEDLIVKEITVDSGVTLKRWRPRAFGRASSIHKHTSNVFVRLAVLEQGKDEVKKTEAPKKEVKKEAPKADKKAEPKKKEAAAVAA
jgi:large subunit ribosomal protein L22